MKAPKLHRNRNAKKTKNHWGRLCASYNFSPTWDINDITGVEAADKRDWRQKEQNQLSASREQSTQGQE